MDMTPDADIGHFRELSDGDSGALRELIELYLTKSAQQLIDLRNATKASTFTEVARLAHSLAGANMMVGMNSLVPTLKELERCGERADLASASSLLEQVDQEFHKVRLTLESTLRTL